MERPKPVRRAPVIALCPHGRSARNTALVGRRDADAGVLDFQYRPISFRPQPHIDPAAGWRVFDRVSDQIVDQLAQSFPVTDDVNG